MQILFKRIIVIFWALWWLIALWTDVVGAVAHLGYVTASWAPDNNYPFLVKSLAMYNVPTSLPAFFYAGINIFSFICVVLFGRAVFALNKSNWLEKANIAFIFSLSYWFMFFLADQLIMNFDLEQNHMVQGGFQLLCYLTLYILPNKD
ncbi:MAG: hypothetical protein PHC75_01555 [Burkholderiales bacterium]|nr:hypothetical protein [Burkholderiales bacterium]